MSNKNLQHHAITTQRKNLARFGWGRLLLPCNFAMSTTPTMLRRHVVKSSSRSNFVRYWLPPGSLVRGPCLPSIDVLVAAMWWGQTSNIQTFGDADHGSSGHARTCSWSVLYDKVSTGSHESWILGRTNVKSLSTSSQPPTSRLNSCSAKQHQTRGSDRGTC